MKKAAKKRPNRAVPVWMRDSEIKDVEASAASKGMTLSAYVRHCVEVVGGHKWAALLPRGKYIRKGKQEVKSDE